jgi:hypothetical protein
MPDTPLDSAAALDSARRHRRRKAICANSAAPRGSWTGRLSSALVRPRPTLGIYLLGVDEDPKAIALLGGYDEPLARVVLFTRAWLSMESSRPLSGASCI